MGRLMTQLISCQQGTERPRQKRFSKQVCRKILTGSLSPRSRLRHALPSWWVSLWNLGPTRSGSKDHVV